MLFSCLSDACLDWWCNNRRGRRKCKVPVSLLLRCWWWCFKRTKCNLLWKVLLNHFAFKKYAHSLSLICSKRHTCYFWNYVLFKISSLLKTIIYHLFTTFSFWKFVSLLVFIVNIAWIYTIWRILLFFAFIWQWDENNDVWIKIIISKNTLIQ